MSKPDSKLPIVHYSKRVGEPQRACAVALLSDVQAYRVTMHNGVYYDIPRRKAQEIARAKLAKSEVPRVRPRHVMSVLLRMPYSEIVSHAS